MMQQLVLVRDWAARPWVPGRVSVKYDLDQVLVAAGFHGMGQSAANVAQNFHKAGSKVNIGGRRAAQVLASAVQSSL